jgi:hypothetical protein
MVTIPMMLVKSKKSNLYIGVFSAGNGGAHHNLYELKKKADSVKEAIEWFNGVVISKKWGLEPKWFSSLSILDKPTFNPSLAGQDELKARDNCYIINNGFEISFTCNNNGDNGCLLQFNTGSRAKPDYREAFVKLNPKYRFFVSHGAGRSRKEELYLEKARKDMEIVYIPEKFRI